jgi:hypothetical protein
MEGKQIVEAFASFSEERLPFVEKRMNMQILKRSFH